jgi:hypothetical protein
MTEKNSKDSHQAASIDNTAAAGQIKAPSSNAASKNLASNSLDSKSSNDASEAAGCEQDPKNKTTKKVKSNPCSKKIGNKNALCHGVFSNEVILPWESSTDFEQLHAGFKDEWKPSGCSEETAVLDLTTATWIKWRAIKMAQLRFFSDPFGVDLLESGKTSWQDILQHQQGVPERTQAALGHMDEVMCALNNMLEIVRNRPYWTETDDGKKIQSQLSQLGHEVSSVIELTKTDIVPHIRSLAERTERNMTMFAHAYDSDVIERQVRVMAAIDTRIDKVLNRLTSLKEYKRMSAPQTRASHLLESPSVVVGAKSAA